MRVRPLCLGFETKNITNVGVNAPSLRRKGSMIQLSPEQRSTDTAIVQRDLSSCPFV